MDRDIVSNCRQTLHKPDKRLSRAFSRVENPREIRRRWRIAVQRGREGFGGMLAILLFPFFSLRSLCSFAAIPIAVFSLIVAFLAASPAALAAESIETRLQQGL